MSVMEWLRHRSDGLQYVDEDMQKLIVEFSLLWMYFEANYLGTDGSPPILLALVQELAKAEVLAATEIGAAFDYFRKRYLADGRTTSHFAALDLKGKYRGQVETGLQSALSAVDQLCVCVLILNRYRNNLFHGPKWIGRFVDEQNNLTHAVALVHAIIAMRDNIVI